MIKLQMLYYSPFSLSCEFRVATADHCPHVDLAQFLRQHCTAEHGNGLLGVQCLAQGHFEI
ncbi:hypothetical protein EXN66_Car007355 [Channa argus]|uniref:Uncharacterized protein n=1 Tax=Channa argus TaxID=215402 RepID=A0A6G1PMZ5_CHAAH|nr:hypothetical protein EXN66_Car007355 [Channa argus]